MGENVEEFCKKYGLEVVTESLSQAYSKFKFTEGQFMKYKESMRYKIPEIEKAIKLIGYLRSKKDSEEVLETNYLLTDGVFSKARLDKGLDNVCLLLGADIMVEYALGDAETLLKKNLANAAQNVNAYEDDLSYLK